MDDRARIETLEHVAIALELADMLIMTIAGKETIDLDASINDPNQDPVESAAFFIGCAKLKIGTALNNGEAAFPAAYLSGLFDGMVDYEEDVLK